MKAAIGSISLAVGLLSGCVSPAPEPEFVWQRLGATRQQFQSEQAQCHLQALSSMGGQPIPYSNNMAMLMYLAQQKQIEESCMQSKGWVVTRK